MSIEAAESPPTQVGAIDESNLLRSVIRLAWPVIVQQVAFSMVQLVDVALVGHLGEDALAGVRVAGQFVWFSQCGMVAVGVGTTAIIARSVGAGDTSGASATLRSAMLMALVWGLAVGLLMFFFGEDAVGLLGAEPEARHEGGVFLSAVAIGMPFMSFVFVGSAALQGAGDTRTPMVIGLAMNAVNIVIAYTLINGAGPFPKLDVLGSGLGFTGAVVFGGSLVLLVLAFGRAGMRWIPWEALKVDRGESRRVLNIGIPAGVEQAQFNVAFMIYTRIIASLGTTALAAHGVTLAIQSLTFNVGFALSVATSALVGQALGAKRPDLAEKSTYLAMRYALVFMCAIGLVLMAFGGPITDLFVGGENADEVVDIGRQLLFIFAFAMPGMAVSLTLGGALRGAGDTRAVLVIMTVTTWLVRLIPAYLLAITFGFGVPGAWAAAILDITTRAALMYGRFRLGRWKTIRV